MNKDQAQLRRQRAMGAGFLLVLMAGAAVWLYAYERSQWPARFAVVDEGRLYRCSQPSKRQIDRLVERFGIKTILIVRSGESTRVPDEKEFAKSRGLRVVQIPIESRSEITESQVQEFFKCVDDPATAPVLVHCSAGRHRTGYLCARYRIDRQGWPVQKAIDELLSFGFDSKHEGVVLEQLQRYNPKESRRP